MLASLLMLAGIQSFTMVDPQDLKQGFTCAPAVTVIIAPHPDGQVFGYVVPAGLTSSGASCSFPDEVKYHEGIFKIAASTTHGGCFTHVAYDGVSLTPAYEAFALSYSYGDPGTRCVGGLTEHATLTTANGTKQFLTIPLPFEFTD
jgi:hypothetical protein